MLGSDRMPDLAVASMKSSASQGGRWRSQWRRHFPQWSYCLVVLGIVFLAYLVIRIIPIIDTAWMSLHNWSLVKPVKPFIGLENYKKLAVDPLFRMALVNTTIFAVVTVPVTLLIAFGVAILLDRPMRGRLEGLYKFLFFLPVVPTMVPVSVIWKWIYDPSYGILNYAMSFFGLPSQGWLINFEAGHLGDHRDDDLEERRLLHGFVPGRTQRHPDKLLRGGRH